MITKVRVCVSFDVEVVREVEHDEGDEPCDLTESERDDVITAAAESLDNADARITDVYPVRQ